MFLFLRCSCSSVWCCFQLLLLVSTLISLRVVVVVSCCCYSNTFDCVSCHFGQLLLWTLIYLYVFLLSASAGAVETCLFVCFIVYVGCYCCISKFVWGFWSHDWQITCQTQHLLRTTTPMSYTKGDQYCV